MTLNMIIILLPCHFSTSFEFIELSRERLAIAEIDYSFKKLRISLLALTTFEHHTANHPHHHHHIHRQDFQQASEHTASFRVRQATRSQGALHDHLVMNITSSEVVK